MSPNPDEHYFRSHACMLSHFSRVRLISAPWSVAHQTPLSLGFFKQKYWSGCRALLQRVFPAQGSNLCLFMPPALAVKFLTTSTTREAHFRGQV